MARQRLGSKGGIGTPLAPAPPDTKKALIDYYSTDPNPTSRGAARVTGMSHAWCALHWRKYQEEVEQLNLEKVEAWRQEQIRSLHEKLADVDHAIAEGYKDTRQYEALMELAEEALGAGADADRVKALVGTLERGQKARYDTAKLHTAAQGYYKMLIQLTGTAKPIPIELLPSASLMEWASNLEPKAVQALLEGDRGVIEREFMALMEAEQRSGTLLPPIDVEVEEG